MLAAPIVCPSTPIYRRPDGTFGTGTANEIAEEKTQYERIRLDREAEELAERRRREAQEQAAAAEAEKKVRAQTATRVESLLQAERSQGYVRISFETFQLDGRELASSNAKISISGIYMKLGEVEILLASEGQAILAHQTHNIDQSIGLITENANRGTRKYFLECQNANVMRACPFVAVGHAGQCTKTNLLGSKEIPCLILEGGRPPP
jgi:hypothetical protein